MSECSTLLPLDMFIGHGQYSSSSSSSPMSPGRDCCCPSLIVNFASFASPCQAMGSCDMFNLCALETMEWVQPVAARQNGYLKLATNQLSFLVFCTPKKVVIWSSREYKSEIDPRLPSRPHSSISWAGAALVSKTAGLDQWRHNKLPISVQSLSPNQPTKWV